MAAGLITLALVLSLAGYFLPAYLARQRAGRQSADYYTAPVPTPQDIFSNASIAYALQLATFGPFFVFGFTGQFLPGIINSLFFMLGVFVLFWCRHRIIPFIKERLIVGDSVTLHAFMAHAHHDSVAVRRIASILTIIALWGIVASEMFGATAVLTPLLGSSKEASFLAVVLIFFCMFIYTTIGGNVGVERTDQLQLGVAYIGLFSAVAIMTTRLLHDRSDDLPVSLLTFGVCVAVLVYRRGAAFLNYRFRSIFDESLARRRRDKIVARVYFLVEALANYAVTAAAAVVIVVTLVVAYLSMRSLGRHGIDFTSLFAHRQFSPLALVAIAILPLAYQICDVSNWQRIAATRPDLLSSSTSGGASEVAETSLRKGLMGFAIEAPITWVLLVGFGAVASEYRHNSSDDPLNAFIAGLLGSGDMAAAVILALLLLAILAMALSTMDAVLSATLYAFRYDVLYSSEGHGDIERDRRRIAKANRFGFVTYAAVVVVLLVLQAKVTFGTGPFLAVLIGIYSAQISFLPLVLAGLFPGKAGSTATATGAIATLLTGFAVGIGCTVYGVVTGNAEWSWAAIPACIVSSFLVYSCASWNETRASRRGSSNG